MSDEHVDATYARCNIDIRAVMDRYAVSIARRDWDGVASCYTQDATFQELPPVEIFVSGRDAIVKSVVDFASSLQSMFMMIHSCLIDTDGAVAHAFTVLHEKGRTKDEEDFDMFGYYSDKLVNQDGNWRIRERKFQPVQWRFPQSLAASLELVTTSSTVSQVGVSTVRI